MNNKLTGSFSLEGLFEKVGILLKNEDGTDRDIVDIIEDMYLRLDTKTLLTLFYAIGEEERFGNNIFEEARNVKNY